MGVSLVLVRHDLTQQEVAVRHATEVVGRHTDCKIRIPDASVSRQHCEISSVDGKVMLRDLGSSNGTFVNKKRITQAELRAGDLLCVGKFVFVVRIDGKPAEIDSEESIEDGEVALGGGESAPPAKAPARSSQPAGTQPRQAGQPAKPKSILNESVGDSEDSSVMDFDFLDDDKDAPKL